MYEYCLDHPQYHIETLHPGPDPSPRIACHQPGGITNRSPGSRIVSIQWSQTCCSNKGYLAPKSSDVILGRSIGIVEVFVMY
jgi:hypothetical protein